MVVRLAKLALGFLIGMTAGFALSVLRPATDPEQPTEGFP